MPLVPATRGDRAAKPPVTPEERERGRIVGLAALGAAAVIAVVVTIGIFIPALGAMFSNALVLVYATATPDVDRRVRRRLAPSVSATPELLDAARVRAGRGGRSWSGCGGTCPDGVCVRNGACFDVVFVKTTDDRFAPPYTVEDQTEES